MKYFVSYFGKKDRTFFRSGTAGMGNAVVEIKERMSTMETIRAIEKELAMQNKTDSCLVIYFTPLED